MSSDEQSLLNSAVQKLSEFIDPVDGGFVNTFDAYVSFLMGLEDLHSGTQLCSATALVEAVQLLGAIPGVAYAVEDGIGCPTDLVGSWVGASSISIDDKGAFLEFT